MDTVIQQLQHNLAIDIIPLLIALLIGFITGWWIWANRVRVTLSDDAAPPAPTLSRVAHAATPPMPIVVPPPAVVVVESAPAARVSTDNLLQIKGVGPKLVTLLATLGVTRFDQIAGWTADDAARIDAQLGTFAGRIARDNWIDQAGYLASGDIAAFEAKYGKLDSGTP